MDKCADEGNDCDQEVKSCNGDYIAIPKFAESDQYKCCLTDDAGVAEVLNTDNYTVENTIAVLVGSAVFVLLTFVHFHYAAEKIRNGAAKASSTLTNSPVSD